VEDKIRGVEILYWELVRARGILEAREKALEVAEDLAKVNVARLKRGRDEGGRSPRPRRAWRRAGWTS